MNVIEVSKVLSNKIRFDILTWLKDPESNFPPHTELGHFDFGVCVQFIQEKAGLSQPVISTYLKMMQNCGLVVPTRIGKWTYYKRDEEVIKSYSDAIRTL